MESLEDIIKGCQRNKIKYQKMLYDRFADTMFGICLRYAKTKEEAEDIFQEGFIKVFKYVDKYRHTGSFEGWVRKIFLNTAISNFRNNKHKYYHAQIEVTERNLPLVEYEELSYTEEELLSVINELPDGYRLVFNLFVIEGYKHKEIAKMLDIDESTSKTQLFRARRLLQERLMMISKRKQIKAEKE